MTIIKNLLCFFVGHRISVYSFYCWRCRKTLSSDELRGENVNCTDRHEELNDNPDKQENGK